MLVSHQQSDLQTRAALAHLERALYGDGARRPSRKGFLISLSLHTACILLFVAGFAPLSDPLESASAQKAVPVFLPLIPDTARPPQPLRTAETSLIPPSLQLPLQPAPEVTVDLNAMQLSFADDVRNQLPEVVRRQHGTLALLDKSSPTIARYLFQPPDWEVRAGIADVSSRLRILMDPPRKWTLLRALGERYRIALDQYQASAVFDVDYRRCLQAAIRQRAATMPNVPLNARVTSARLAFEPDRPCGIEVLEVSIAAKPLP